jgi:hypothetical protein
MATIDPIGSWIARGVHQVTWSALTGSGDTVNAYSAPHLPDKTVTVTATGFNSAVVTLVGSNDPTATGTYVTLNDPQGNALTFTANKVETLLENPRWIKPMASGATGGDQSFTIIMVSRADPR